MRLICLWINNYKRLSETHLLIDSSYSINSDLVLKKGNQAQRPYGCFESITALIGKNGSGKSSVIDVIRSILVDETSVDACLVIEFDDQLYYLGEECPFQSDSKSIDPLAFLSRDMRRKIVKSLHSIFCSPVYNPHADTNGVGAIIHDVSSDATFKHRRMRNREVDLYMQFDFLDQMDGFARKYLGFERYLEISVKFIEPSVIRRKIAKFLLFSTRNGGKLQVEVARRFDFDFFSSRTSSGSEDEVGERIAKLKSDIKNRFQDKENLIKLQFDMLGLSDQVEFHFLITAVNNAFTINENFFKRRELARSAELVQCILDLMEVDDILSWTKRWKKQIPRILNGRSKFSSVDGDISLFKKILSGQKMKVDHLPLMILPKQGKDAISLIADLRAENILRYGFLFGWKGISSGEVAKLNLFSRMFHSLKGIRSDRILLMMDEGDIYLHPEWQRTFLHELSTYFNAAKSIIQRNFKISMILTTHSPLMISDLYKEDVHLLHEGKRVGQIQDAEKETFGANIYNLYKEEFVISSSRGEFANTVIDGLLQDLKETNSRNEPDKSVLRSKIERIGDPLIRTGLLSYMEE